MIFFRWILRRRVSIKWPSPRPPITTIIAIATANSATSLYKIIFTTFHIYQNSYYREVTTRHFASHHFNTRGKPLSNAFKRLRCVPGGSGRGSAYKKCNERDLPGGAVELCARRAVQGCATACSGKYSERDLPRRTAYSWDGGKKCKRILFF